jgi:hypothetical protein
MFRQNPSILILLLMFVWASVGCQASPASSSKASKSIDSSPTLPDEDELSNLDLGQDWDTYEKQLGSRNTPDRAPARSTRTLSSTFTDTSTGPKYAIVLGTFASDRHLELAQEFQGRLAMLFPEMESSIQLHPTTGGSLVIYGSYTGWNDERAKADVQKLQEITINGRQIFPQVIIAELKSPRDPASIDDAELLSLRVRYPDIRVLYTLEIAMWGDFESGQMPPASRRRAAEQYARSLRERGVPAFYHHDETRDLSMVTVGVFDHRAIDGQTGLRSSQVDRFLLDFPQRRVNGEPVIDLYDPKQPEKGGRPQQPRIVEVPRL